MLRFASGNTIHKDARSAKNYPGTILSNAM